MAEKSGAENSEEAVENPPDRTANKPYLVDLWNQWAALIETNRESKEGFTRFKGWVQQLITESIIYVLVGVGFACALTIIDYFTFFTTMPDPSTTFPAAVGSVVTLLFITSWDNWVRRERKVED